MTSGSFGERGTMNHAGLLAALTLTACGRR